MLSCCSVVHCSITVGWLQSGKTHSVAVLKNCTSILQNRDRAFILCACMIWRGLDRICSSHSLSPCVTSAFVVPTGRNQVWFLLCYVLYNTPWWSLSCSADNLKETVWQINWNNPSRMSPPICDSVPAVVVLLVSHSGILKLYMDSYWWGLGYLTQKNPQDLALFLAMFLALMWLSDPTANTKSVSRSFRLLFGFGLIFYMESRGQSCCNLGVNTCNAKSETGPYKY